MTAEDLADALAEERAQTALEWTILRQRIELWRSTADRMEQDLPAGAAPIVFTTSARVYRRLADELESSLNTFSRLRSEQCT
jgi:hypothetical protein